MSHVLNGPLKCSNRDITDGSILLTCFVLSETKTCVMDPVRIHWNSDMLRNNSSFKQQRESSHGDTGRFHPRKAGICHVTKIRFYHCLLGHNSVFFKVWKIVEAYREWHEIRHYDTYNSQTWTNYNHRRCLCILDDVRSSPCVTEETSEAAWSKMSFKT